jgi:hypothetical protein
MFQKFETPDRSSLNFIGSVHSASKQVKSGGFSLLFAFTPKSLNPKRTNDHDAGRTRTTHAERRRLSVWSRLLTNGSMNWIVACNPFL